MFRGSPPQLPALVRGEKIRNGPYVVTVTDEMVRERERLNADLALRWQQGRQPAPPSGPQSEYFDEFQEAKVRRRFVSRVFGLVSLQLAFTASLVAVCLFVEDVRSFMQNNSYLAMLAALWFFVTALTIIFSQHARRGPLGVACLLVLTASTAYAAAFLSLRYSTWAVLFAASFTAIITLTMSLVSGCTNCDITKYDSIVTIVVMAGGMGLLALYLLSVLLRDSHWLELLVASIAAPIFSMMLLYEVQMIMGGRVIAVLPHEVIFATAQLYMQIIFIYKCLLMCKC